MFLERLKHSSRGQNSGRYESVRPADKRVKTSVLTENRTFSEVSRCLDDSELKSETTSRCFCCSLICFTDRYWMRDDRIFGIDSESLRAPRFFFHDRSDCGYRFSQRQQLGRVLHRYEALEHRFFFSSGSNASTLRGRIDQMYILEPSFSCRQGPGRRAAAYPESG